MDRDITSSQPHALPAGHRIRLLRGLLVTVLLLGFVGVGFMSFLWPAIHAARESASR